MQAASSASARSCLSSRGCGWSIALARDRNSPRATAAWATLHGTPARKVASKAFLTSSAAVPKLLAAKPVLAAVDGAAATTAAAATAAGGLDVTLLAVIGVILAGGFLVLCGTMFSQMDPDSFDNKDERAIGKGTNYDDGSGFNF